MRPSPIMKTTLASISVVLSLGFSAPVCKSAEQRQSGKNSLPTGLMLNLDFKKSQDGLIPSKTLYPLFVPKGELEIHTIDNREILVFRKGQGLDIPHSSLLDPDGGEWIAVVRVFLTSDGIILSQGNGQQGYAIYTQDGVVHVAIQTGGSTVVLKESQEKGITHYLGKWVTIDVRIKPGMAILNLNRARVATIPLPSPFTGKECAIRIGEHQTLPAPLQDNTTLPPTGFTGAVSSLKILRQ